MSNTEGVKELMAIHEIRLYPSNEPYFAEDKRSDALAKALLPA